MVSYVYYFASIAANLFAGDWNNGVMLTTDNGTSWNYVNSGLTNTQVRSLYASGSNLYLGTRGAGIFFSTDNGTTWTEINTGLTQKYVYSITQVGSNLFAGTYSLGVFISTDNGANWTAASTGLPFSTVTAFTSSSTNLFAGTDGSGIYLTTNNGTNWTEVNTGLTSLAIRSLLINGSYLFAGGEGSDVWRRPLSEMITGVNEESNYLPADYSLAQNYPNPFNPTTTIKYDLPMISNVKLNVYDELGKVVAKLVDEQQNAGEHSVVFDGSKLSSGIYYYRLEAGNYTQTKKLVLIK